MTVAPTITLLRSGRPGRRLHPGLTRGATLGHAFATLLSHRLHARLPFGRGDETVVIGVEASEGLFGPGLDLCDRDRTPALGTLATMGHAGRGGMHAAGMRGTLRTGLHTGGAATTGSGSGATGTGAGAAAGSFGFTGDGRDCNPRRCALPITALRLTPPSASAIWLAVWPASHIVLSVSIRSSVQDIRTSLYSHSRVAGGCAGDYPLRS